MTSETIKQILSKRRYLQHYWSGRSIKSTVVNRSYLSLKGKLVLLNYKDCPCKYILIAPTIYLSLFVFFQRVYICLYMYVHIYIYKFINCLQLPEWTTIKHIQATAWMLVSGRRWHMPTHMLLPSGLCNPRYWHAHWGRDIGDRVLIKRGCAWGGGIYFSLILLGVVYH